MLTGKAAFTDYTKEAPGVRRHLTLADLPEPKPEESVNNGPHLVPRPDGAWPVAPAGFKVTLYAGGDAPPMQRADNKQVMAATPGTFRMPRLMRTAPNGDIFLADSGAGIIFVLRGVGANGKAMMIEKFATGLDHPFGISFYPAADPRYVYVGNATTIQRFAYKSGDLHASSAAETVVPDIPGYAQLTGGGHWTRDVVFSKDGRHMLVSVGSGSNVDDADTHPKEFHRADVLEYTPDGKFEKIYASGIRNCVGEAINPITGALWCSVNERDGLGDNLVPDYISSVPEDSFFGWPWWYMGGHQDPRLMGKHPELRGEGAHTRRDSESAFCFAGDGVLSVARVYATSGGYTRHQWNRPSHKRVPRRLQRRCLRSRTRLVEPCDARRLRSYPRAYEGRRGYRRVRGFSYRVCNEGR